MGETKSTRTLRQISSQKIRPNPENPRLIFRQDEMDSLMVSIDAHGILVPLTVYQENNEVFLIDGERRLRCANKLNLPSVPALVQEKPTELQNLLLMYNIHALREQWDYYTIASNLTRVIELHELETGYKPNEVELSESTGLTRGQIRRCRLLLDLPERFKKMLLKELQLPKLQQKLSEDFFIEMERALKTVVKRFPDYENNLESIRDTLVKKFRNGTIQAVTDFRQMSKIATAVDNLELDPHDVTESLDKIFSAEGDIGIRVVYEDSVSFEYNERQASLRLQFLTGFLDEVIQSGQETSLDEEFLEEAEKLYECLSQLLRKTE